MYLREEGPGAIRGLLFKDASSHRASIPHVFRQFATDAPVSPFTVGAHMLEEKREAVLAIETAVAHSLSTGRSAPIKVPV